MDYLFLILGFILLFFSGDYLVRSGVALASYFKVSPLVIGVTVISMGTSAPELFVSLEAALTGSDDISVGNVVGSNIANVALVLAITALILPLPLKRDSRRIDWPVMMFVSLLLYAFAMNLKLELYEGVIFVALLVGYILFSIFWSRKQGKKTPAEEIPKVKYSLPVAILILVICIGGLYFGSDLLIDGAKNIALDLGVSQRVIGISLVAFGTSVPELATSVIAAIRKETDISVGNILGSNIFNILSILGITSIIQPLSINPAILNFDMIWMLGICVVLFFTMAPFISKKITRLEGGILLSLYLAYLYFLFFNSAP